MDRTGYIGGSDFYELLPSGCELRLWKVKRGAAGPEETGHMRRGTKLEPLIVEEYVEITGRRVEKVQGEQCIHDIYPWVAARPDRWTWRPGDSERGVLECKSAAPHVFRTFQREGLPEAYIAQVNWEMYVGKTIWGAFAILEPVEWKLITFDTNKDEALVEGLHERGSKFWSLVENGPAPEKLSPTSKQCRHCRFRDECHPWEPIPADDPDFTRDDSIEELAADVAKARAIKKDAVAYEEECSDALAQALGARTKVLAGEFKILRQTTPRAGYTVAPTNVTTLRVQPATKEKK